MIRNAIRQIDLRRKREAYYDLTFGKGLDICSRLGKRAPRLIPDPIADWREDLSSNVAIARVVPGPQATETATPP